MRTSPKKWERLSAVILTFALLLSILPATAMAISTGDKSIDNEVHYQVNGAIDAGVRYWSMEYDEVDTDGSILLNGSKFADRSNQWGLSNTEPYAGRFLLNFHRVEFYEQIQNVSIVSGNNVTEFDKEANGALWTVPINTRTWASGKIGVVTNSQIRITLKNGQTLEGLQLENTPISFETFAVTGSGNPGGSSMMVNRSWDQGFILANNQNRKDEQKTGFLTGPMSNRISLDYNQLTGQMVIKSIHSFKPNVKMSTTDLYWVVYIKEQIPKELLPYIDTANIRLGATNEDGRGDKPGSEFRTDTPVTIDIDSNGLVDTSRVSAISIAQSDTRDALNAARNRLEKSVFSVATGQNANFTIQYPLRENVSVRDFAIFLNQYITEHDNQLLFDSWLESDYPNEKDGYGLVYAGTLDHGAPYKHLTDSYANAYIPMNDSDKDGLWDFIENQVGSNMNLVDTDGDGVPDGSELLDDSTDPVDAADYKAAAPQTGSTVLYGGIENTIEGTAPKLVYQDPGDKVIEVPVTSQQAGNALVKLQGYDDTTNTFTDVIYGSAVIPFDQLQAGNFRIDLAKDALTAVAGEKVVLVSYSPNGKNPAMGVPLQVLHLDKVIPVDPNHPGTVPDGYVTVTFDPGQGSWKDGTTPSSYYVQKDVEVTPADFQAVTDNLEAPADHIFSKWDGFPENGQFTADEQLTASFADSREIIEVTPKDPDQPFNPENADDGNNSQKTPQGFVRVIFESGEHGTFGTYAGGQDKVKVAYDVKAGQTWEKIAAPAVTAKPGYTAKSGAELWNPQLPGEAETVAGGTYTAQYTKNSGGKVLWYQEIYLQNPDGTFSRWSYGHGGFAKANTTVRMDLTAFDGQKTAWGDTLGVEYVFDADNAKNRLSDIVENAGKQTPLCAYYKRAPHTVTYQYEGTVPDGAPTVPAKVDSWYGANVLIAEPPTLAGYVFSGWTTDTAGAVIDKGILTMPNTDVVLKGIWTKDVATTAMVTFRIANGTWVDGTTADKHVMVPLISGKGTLDAASIPTGMKANSGYIGGVWDVQPSTSPDTVTGDVVYTYSFKPNKPGVTYRVMFKFVSLTKDENGQPKELPQAVRDLLPASITGLKRNDTVTYPLLDKTSVSVTDGTWVFAGWPGGTSATITGNILEVGGWRFESAPKVFFPTMGIMIERQRIDVPAEGPNGSNINLPEMFRPITVTLGTVERSFEVDTVGAAGFPLTIRFTNYPDSEFSEGDYPIMVDNLPEGYTYELLVNDKAVQSPIRVDKNLSNIMLNIRKTYTLAYDTNGGNADGPTAQSGLLPDTYPLSTTKPTHASVDGKAVVWIGWTAEQDTTIYERGAASFDPSHLLTTVTISNKDETVYALWGYDENGNGTADVLEQTATITFRITNGTWADGSTADKKILILLHEGKGTLDAASIPTGMKANSGYTGGTWDQQPDTTADAVTGNLFYNYSFRRDSGHGGHDGHSGSTRYTLTYVSNGGTEYKAEWYDSGTTVKLNKTPVREGYLFTGWYADKKLTDEISRIKMTGNKTVYAGWEKNAPALHIPDMLNGDDHFAYVAGYTDGTVRPNAKITRAEVAMIFYRLLDEDVRAANENDSNAFSDVTDGMWFNTAVSTIARLDIVKGRSTEIFDPNAPITRAEFATICARFDHSKVESTESFSDIHGHWAEKFVERAAALGWVNGYMDGTFCPNATITRAEAMAMINRVLGRLPESEKDLLPGMKTWPDNADPSAWYYLTIQEATNGHTFERKADGVHERWIKLK